jgi:hypothetical protein
VRHAAARELNRRKVKTATGAPWSAQTVIRVRTRLAAGRSPTRASAMDHTNLFRAALVAVHDIATNSARDTAAWAEVLDTVEHALAEARRLDARERPSQSGRE